MRSGDVRLDLDDHLAANRLAVDQCFRRLQSHHGVAAIDVVLPTDPGDAVAVAEGPAVADRDIGRRQMRRGSVDVARNELAAAIRQLNDQTTVAACRIARDQQAQVGREAHASFGVTLGEIEINDAAIGFVLRVDAEGDRAVQPIVGPSVAERRPPSYAVRRSMSMLTTAISPSRCLSGSPDQVDPIIAG